MRFIKFILLPILVIVAVGILIAGQRGNLSRRPPIEVFPDMDRQLKLRPMEPNSFFANGLSSQPHVTGTIPRSTPIPTASGPVMPYEDSPVINGLIKGSTNFIELNPLKVDARLLARGQQRYTITCSPCHGQLADGNGVTKKLGMTVVANLHDSRIVKMGDGEIFNVISQGRGLMQGYAAQLDVQDRWAIVAYVRALQLARLGSIDDVPEAERANLPK